MKVLIVSPNAAFSPHFETELELAQRHLDAGDQVEVVSCWGELPGCDLGFEANPKTCHICRTRRQAGWQLVEPQVKQASICGPIRHPYPSTLPEPIADAEALKQWRPFQADLGWGVLSTLISATASPEPDFRRFRWLVRRLAASAESIFRSVAARLDRDRPDRVYLFNGRLALQRPVLRACEQAGIDYFVHERGCDTSHYELAHNTMPHDIDWVDAAIRANWQAAAADPDRDAVAAQWYIDRVNRVERSWHSFTKGQTPRALPPGWDPSRHNVVIFTSSEDEFAAIGDRWRNPVYPHQREGVERLVADLPARDARVHVTVRMHPNQARLKNRHTDALRRLSGPHVSVVQPEDTVDTYELLRAATVVVTFGSTVGIEAVFWEKPSVLIGPSFYHKLGAALRVHSHEEAVQAILHPPAAGDRSLALAYGHWLQTHGHRFRHFEPDGLFAGRFKGTAIRGAKPLPWQRVGWGVARMSRWLREGSLRPNCQRP